MPIGIAALVFGISLIGERPGSGIRDGVDVLGAFIVTATVMLVVYAIVKASTDGWLSERTLGAGLVAVAMVALFIWVERHVRRPIVPLGIFRSRNITGATIVRALFPIGLFGQFFIGALYLQHVLGYGPLETGLAFMPMNLMVTVFSLVISARLMTRVGAKLTILPGLVLILGGLILLSRVPVNGSYLLDVFPGMALFGAGAGLAFAPSVALAMADAAPRGRRSRVGAGQCLAPTRSSDRCRRPGEHLVVSDQRSVGSPCEQVRGARRRLPPRLPRGGRLHRRRDRTRRSHLQRRRSRSGAGFSPQGPRTDRPSAGPGGRPGGL